MRGTWADIIRSIRNQPCVIVGYTRAGTQTHVCNSILSIYHHRQIAIICVAKTQKHISYSARWPFPDHTHTKRIKNTPDYHMPVNRKGKKTFETVANKSKLN